MIVCVDVFFFFFEKKKMDKVCATFWGSTRSLTFELMEAHPVRNVRL